MQLLTNVAPAPLAVVCMQLPLLVPDRGTSTCPAPGGSGLPAEDVRAFDCRMFVTLLQLLLGLAAGGRKVGSPHWRHAADVCASRRFRHWVPCDASHGHTPTKIGSYGGKLKS